MNTLAFAWRSLVRQPARAVLGIVGVAAVAALLFDMLLLSRGLVLSMQDLLDRGGFDVRITATESLPGAGPRIRNAFGRRRHYRSDAERGRGGAVQARDAEVGSSATTTHFVSFFGADAKAAVPGTSSKGPI